ncbi:MAG: tautomerase family protein [Brevinematia bacterium]
MPLVRVDIYKGKSQEYKKALLDGIHQALVEAFKIPENDRNQRLYEFESENFDRKIGKLENFTINECFKYWFYSNKKLQFSRFIIT